MERHHPISSCVLHFYYLSLTYLLNILTYLLIYLLTSSYYLLTSYRGAHGQWGEKSTSAC